MPSCKIPTCLSGIPATTRRGLGSPKLLISLYIYIRYIYIEVTTHQTLNIGPLEHDADGACVLLWILIQWTQQSLGDLPWWIPTSVEWSAQVGTCIVWPYDGPTGEVDATSTAEQERGAGSWVGSCLAWFFLEQRVWDISWISWDFLGYRSHTWTGTAISSDKHGIWCYDGIQ